MTKGLSFRPPPAGLLKPSANSVIAFLDEPDQAEAAGGLVISVPAGKGQRSTAARILGSHGGHGGHDMAHFGRDHWEPLGA